MILAIDMTRTLGQRTGVGTYLWELVEASAGQELPFDEIRLVAPAALPPLPADDRFLEVVRPVRGSVLLWQATSLVHAARDADVLLGAYTLPAGVRGRGAVLNLGILHGRDARHVRGVRARLRARHAAVSARGARLVIVNSELTRADVVREYGVAAERVAVVPDPVIPAAHGSSAERGSVRRLAGADDFVLYVGKLSRRRRIPELLAAYEIVRRGRPGLRLVLAGPEGDAPVERIAGALGLEPHVRVAYLPAAELRDLYASARVLVMLADHEGFGRPVTEAMAAGCPVVVAAGSTIGALERAVTREGLVLESAADDPVALAATLELVLADADLRAGLVRTGRAYVEALDTPAAAAQRIMAHLAEAAGSPA